MVGSSVDWSVYWPVGRLIRRSVGSLVSGRFVGWTVGQLVGRAVSRLVGSSVGRLVGCDRASLLKRLYSDLLSGGALFESQLGHWLLVVFLIP